MNLSQSQNRNLGQGRGRKTCELNLSQSQNRNLGHGRGGRTCELNLSQSQNINLGHGRGRKTCELNLSQSQNRNLGHGRGRLQRLITAELVSGVSILTGTAGVSVGHCRWISNLDPAVHKTEIDVSSTIFCLTLNNKILISLILIISLNFN